MDDETRKLVKSAALKAAIVFVLWVVGYHGFIRPNGRLDHWFSMKVVEFTKNGISILGYNTAYGINPDGKGINPRYIFVDGTPVLSVADGCNGVELIALFIGFFIIFPGNWRSKTVFILLGSIGVFLLNVIREMALAFNYMYFRQSFDLNHKYTFVLIVYGLIFIVWRYWLNNYSFLKELKQENAQKS
ncbi:MAG: archaeosortase/exosortase family protein [Cyclobacteriaceae bacterium]